MAGIIWIIIIMIGGPLLGSLFGVSRHYSEKQIKRLLAFAAGVMVSVSVFELLPESIALASSGAALGGLAAGGALMYILNVLAPHFHHSGLGRGAGRDSLGQTVFFIFLGITIHNLPEGAAIGVGALSSFDFSLLIALAIALHDIPEAICVAAPYYYLTGRKLTAFLMTALTALPTAAGFLLAYWLFDGLADSWLGWLVGFTAGVMVYISLFEIMPALNRGQRISRIAAAASFLAGAGLVLFLEKLLGVG